MNPKKMNGGLHSEHTDVHLNFIITFVDLGSDCLSADLSIC